MDIELIAPSASLHDEWLAQVAEWGGVEHHPGAANHLSADLDLRERADFATWVVRLNNQLNADRTGSVPATSWWITRAGHYLGAIQLRHELSELLTELGGHIGYHVRPSARRGGVARAALVEVIGHARGLGIPEVLVTCDEDNIASRRTAESVGGRLAKIRPVDAYSIENGFTKPTCHYWISTAS